MSKLRLVVLESDDADGNAIGAIVGVLREMNITRGGGPDVEPQPALERDAPAALPAPKQRKARAPKPDQAGGSSKSGRAGGAGATILAALKRSSRPDLPKLAAAIYADSTKTQKVKQVLTYMVRTGKLSDHQDGTYSIVD